MHAPSTSLPPLQASHWFNSPAPPTLDGLRGKVVAIHAFQMLCPACVAQALPQASRLHDAFAGDDFAVIGLHTVFEHHAVMGAAALQAFIHEYRLRFPIGIDEADPRGPIPRTMAAWNLRGTPSLLLLDRDGALRLSHFGHIDDLLLGALIGRLLQQAPRQAAPAAGAGCDEHGCAVPGPA